METAFFDGIGPSLAGFSTQAPCLGERTRAKTVAFSFARIVGNSLANDRRCILGFGEPSGLRARREAHKQLR